MMRRIGRPVVILLLVASCAPVKTVKLPPPFKSTPDEEKNVDRLLARWEQWNAGVKTFDCRFKRWVYDAVFGRPDQPAHVDLGTIKYAAPDRGLFRIDSTTAKDGREVAIEDERAENWISDGNSIFEYNHVKKQVIEYKLHPTAQGTKLVDGPLTVPFYDGPFSYFFGSPTSPFPFAAKAKALKEQFYLREVTPRDAQHDQIYLEAYPRSSTVAANCQKLQLIFRPSDMSPVAMKIVQSNGKDYVVYAFFDIAVNAPPTSPANDPFQPVRPLGWQKVAESSPLGR